MVLLGTSRGVPLRADGRRFEPVYGEFFTSLPLGLQLSSVQEAHWCFLWPSSAHFYLPAVLLLPSTQGFPVLGSHGQLWWHSSNPFIRLSSATAWPRAKSWIAAVDPFLSHTLRTDPMVWILMDAFQLELFCGPMILWPWVSWGGRDETPFPTHWTPNLVKLFQVTKEQL